MATEHDPSQLFPKVFWMTADLDGGSPLRDMWCARIFEEVTPSKVMKISSLFFGPFLGFGNFIKFLIKRDYGRPKIEGFWSPFWSAYFNYSNLKFA